MDRDYRIDDVGDHYEVYIYGKFYCSADSFSEAVHEAEHFFCIKKEIEEERMSGV